MSMHMRMQMCILMLIMTPDPHQQSSVTHACMHLALDSPSKLHLDISMSKT